ncbi:MAG TPA: ABC transporter permease [Gammaproteobacteria bacterium]|nr:ABC transporter permease [Gammaproteobacteria bacterium]
MRIAELKGAWRAVTRAPGYAVVAVAVLALGIGATTSVYAVLKTVVLNPLPYPAQHELVRIIEQKLPRFPEFSVVPGKFLVWDRDSTAFSSLAMWRGATQNLTGRAEPARLYGTHATVDLFRTIGLPMTLGRGFEQSDLDEDVEPVVLSHGAWMNRFGGDAGVLGTAITMSGRSYTVIGVLPPRYDFPSPLAEVYTLWRPGEREAQQMGAHYAGVIGRLAPGRTIEAARSELNTIAERLEQEFPEEATGWRVIIDPLLDRVLGDAGKRIYLLLGGVALVLLITCANVAGLTLVRTAGRVHELAIRRTQGATGASIARQLLLEGTLLASLGGLVGLALAAAALPLIRAAAPAGLPRIDQLALDPAVALVAICTSLLAGGLAASVPAMMASRRAVAVDLRDGGRGAVGSKRGGSRGLLVAGEVALAVVLLIAAALLGRSMLALNAVDPGFAADTSIFTRIALPSERYAEDPQSAAFFGQLAQRAAELPGVASAGVVQSLPMVNDYVLSFRVDGRPAPPHGEEPSAIYYSVDPGYFAAMDIPMVRGRGILPSDRADGRRVMVVSESFAARFFPGGDVIGQRIDLGSGEPDWREVVGVVADVRHYGLDARLEPQMYEPFAQNPFGNAFLVMNSKVLPAALTGPVRALVRELDADQPVGELRSLASVIEDSLADRRFGAWLIGGFAATALLLAAIGLYGTLAYAVRQTVREIGVRLAIGARPGDVLRAVLRRGVVVAALGVTVGLALALVGTRLLESFVFGISVRDPAVFGGIAAAMLGVAVAASVIPAWRASRIDPMRALREE